MNEISLPDMEGKTLLKAIIVVLYTMIGVSTAVLPIHAMRIRQFPTELVPHLELPAYILLGMVLLFGMLLGAKRKTSASWAVIAYGSICVGLLKYVASAHWYAKDQLPENWVGMSISTTLVLLLTAMGLYAASQGRWKQMVGWSLLVYFGMFLCTPVLLYAQYAYCQRHDLLHKAK